jgi:hypothetical protein
MVGSWNCRICAEAGASRRRKIPVNFYLSRELVDALMEIFGSRPVTDRTLPPAEAHKSS